MNVGVKIENMEFKSLIGSLANGKIDLIAAGMTVTEERKKLTFQRHTLPQIK